MRTMLKDQVTCVLAPLLGKPLWGSGRGRYIQWFYIGDHRTITTLAQEREERGEYSLEISCAWRLSTACSIVVASGDLVKPKEGIPEPGEDFDPLRPGTTLCDAKVQEFIDQECPLSVQAATADDVGGFRLALERGFLLDVFPDYSTEHEHWRLVKSDEDPRHIILSGKGLEEQ